MKKIPKRLQRASHRLVDLLDRAIVEGEKSMYIVVSHQHVTRYANKQFHGYEVRINVGYIHGEEKREVTAYKTLSPSYNYNPALRVQDVISKIENKGLEVKAISGMNLENFTPRTTNP